MLKSCYFDLLAQQSVVSCRVPIPDKRWMNCLRTYSPSGYETSCIILSGYSIIPNMSNLNSVVAYVVNVRNTYHPYPRWTNIVLGWINTTNHLYQSISHRCWLLEPLRYNRSSRRLMFRVLTGEDAETIYQLANCGRRRNAFISFTFHAAEPVMRGLL